MYQLYIERESDYSPKKIAEFKELEDAQARAEKEKASDSSLKYIIEETNGSINSYGELMSYVVEEG